MSNQEFVIHIGNEDVIVRMGDIVVPGVRMVKSTFGTVRHVGDIVVPGVRVMGGVPGPPGRDTGAAIEAIMEEHIQSPTPHPAYDDLPAMTLLFENGLI